MNFSVELKQKLNLIPQLPGIYKMLDSRGNIIYVGKSKCLRKRVRSYFTGKHKSSKIEKLVSFIDNIDYIVADTHLEAKLLECELIKEIKPIFNSQMKNDGRYVYLKIADKYNPYKTLTVEPQRSEYSYGPFRHKYAIYEMIDAMMNIFPISKQNNLYLFDYNPIPLTMEQARFEENRRILVEIFSDTKCMNSFLNILEDKMKKAAISYKYETAAKYRDIIQGLNYVSYRINDYANFLSQDYLLKIPAINGVKLFLVSGGYILSKKLFKNPTRADIDLFINNAYLRKTLDIANMNEKAAIDYHDIIYSEIESLPKEFYEIISSS